MSDTYDDDFEPIEGYCMSCRDTVEIENPQAVWTRRGQPATRGDCSICGGTVFRMGKTDMHREANRPEPVVIGHHGDKRTAPKLERDTVYLNYAAADEATAQQLAADLEKSGIAVWLHSAEDNVNWSSGVHPALKECRNMVYVLSDAALEDKDVIAAWQFFRDERKPIIIAQIAAIDPPDRIRRSPRFDLLADYKPALRQMVRTIGNS
ncbi:MAG: DUF5679 domain-containing protein [Anaerolineae bacterium]|nr:DUF5679 domain-containing protein [Anaerolineae bacterium]MDQ7037190.1 DUF5679 domain-containing protein [Anaerolineae bacterium]